MSIGIYCRAGALRAGIVVGCVATAVAVLISNGWAGDITDFGRRSVGGISVDAEGVVSQAAVEDVQLRRRAIAKRISKAPGKMDDAVELRKISLRGLNAAIADAMENNLGVLPPEIKYLAGIQRVQYILVYPEQNDIVLAGPGEGWVVNESGDVVGATTGQPVLRLEDLLVALRTVDSARTVGITCSIDPTPEGRRELDAFIRKQKQFNRSVLKGVEDAMGLQEISITGVPKTSHFARILVAADYRMKRIAMKLEPTPLAELPSFLDMIQASPGGLNNMMPRWWMACDYEPIAKSADGLAFEIRGQGVKAMTEDEFVTDQGTVQGTGQVNPIAQKWADAMTEHYTELSAKEAIFGQLRNLMDMCVLAALIEKEDLFGMADCQVPLLTDADSKLGLEKWDPPTTVATQASAIKKGRNWIITASGGVDIDSWKVAGRSVVEPAVKQIQTKATAPSGAAWWWN